MSRQWAIVRFSSADAADNANTGSLSVNGPPGVSMGLALQPAADDIVGVPHHNHHHHDQEGEEEEGGAEQQGNTSKYMLALDEGLGTAVGSICVLKGRTCGWGVS